MYPFTTFVTIAAMASVATAGLNSRNPRTANLTPHLVDRAEGGDCVTPCVQDLFAKASKGGLGSVAAVCKDEDLIKKVLKECSDKCKDDAAIGTYDWECFLLLSPWHGRLE